MEIGKNQFEIHRMHTNGINFYQSNNNYSSPPRIAKSKSDEM